MAIEPKSPRKRAVRKKSAPAESAAETTATEVKLPKKGAAIPGAIFQEAPVAPKKQLLKAVMTPKEMIAAVEAIAVAVAEVVDVVSMVLKMNSMMRAQRIQRAKRVRKARAKVRANNLAHVAVAVAAQAVME